MMRNDRPVRWPIVLLLLVVGVGSVAPVAADDDPRIRAYQEQLDRMQKEMDEMRGRLRALEEERHAPGRAAEPSAAVKPPATAPVTASAPAPIAPVAAEQDRKIGVLATEIERLKSALVLPENKQLKSAYGLGPAASKVYQVEHGLSIGGYGEFNFQKFVSDQQGQHDQFDMLRFVLYTGYKFSDRILMNAEVEFEHALIGEETASAESGAVEVEFAYLDFLLWKQLNVRAGLLLIPMGFLNEIHEPPFFHGVFRPEVEHVLIPTTWREGGIGIFGTLAPGLEYRGYLMNGLNAQGFESSGIREGRQVGDRAFADDLAGTLRVDYTPFAGLTIGGSMWAGDSGQDNNFAGSKPGVFTLIGETHAQLHYRGLEMRALGVLTNIHDTALVSEQLEDTIGKDQYGFYVEAAYNVLPLAFPESTQYLAPFFRYENYDTQDGIPQGFVRVPGNDVRLYSVGLGYKPHPQVVLKFEYRNFDAGHTSPIPDDISVGAGFVF